MYIQVISIDISILITYNKGIVTCGGMNNAFFVQTVMEIID